MRSLGSSVEQGCDVDDAADPLVRRGLHGVELLFGRGLHAHNEHGFGVGVSSQLPTHILTRCVVESHANAVDRGRFHVGIGVGDCSHNFHLMLLGAGDFHLPRRWERWCETGEFA